MLPRGRKARIRRELLKDVFNNISRTLPQRPKKGWINEIRESIGMTTGQLGKRMKIDQTSVVRLEQSEAKRSITLSSLDKAAEALGCKVQYILIPDRPLDDMLLEQALRMIRKASADAEHTMALEDQGTKKKVGSLSETILAAELIASLSRSFWSE